MKKARKENGIDLLYTIIRYRKKQMLQARFDRACSWTVEKLSQLLNKCQDINVETTIAMPYLIHL